MDSLQQRFGALSWTSGRARVATLQTRRQERLARQQSGVVNYAQPMSGSSAGVFLPWVKQSEGEASSSDSIGRIESILSQLLNHIEQGDAASCKPLVLELQKSLTVVCGVERRAKHGGVQYAANFILDAVLFADTLRQVYDSNAMSNAVRRYLVMSMSSV